MTLKWGDGCRLALHSDISAKALISTEDAFVKRMSTFANEEHLRTEEQSAPLEFLSHFADLPSMSGRSDELRVEVIGDEIVVFLPATSYGVTYYKPPNPLQILVKDFLAKDDSRAPITQAEFLLRAWQAACDRARELGLIV